jgi:hypothetical protein
MKRIITGIAAALSLAILSLSVPVAASAQTAQTRAAQTHSISDAPSPYITYCLSAIDDAIRDADVDTILDRIFHLPKAAEIYDAYSTSSDILQLKYELNHGEYASAPFSASRVIYDFLGQLPDTGAFWSIGNPATSCLEAAVVWDMQTGAKAGAQIRKDLDRFLYGLVPTGLTVSANRSNGTVLLLTWHAHKISLLTSLLLSLLKPGFEVNDGVVNRNTPAGSGTVHYTWTGLTPGSRVCFKVRATYALGDSAWDPNATPWHQCAYTSSPTSSPHPTPTITSVGTYTQGELVYFDIHYADPGNDAEGFGFVGVNGSSWAEESHPFTSPSYGIVGQDSIAYPFNEECGTAQQYDSYVEAWIYDTAGDRSTPVTIHLVCASAGGVG